MIEKTFKKGVRQKNYVLMYQLLQTDHYVYECVWGGGG